jgi:hypothetical protein
MEMGITWLVKLMVHQVLSLLVTVMLNVWLIN